MCRINLGYNVENCLTYVYIHIATETYFIRR